MAHVISFRTGKFDISSETLNPINPIAGQSVLNWLRESLAGSGYTLGQPDAEDWGWYMDVHANAQSYLVGASAEPDEGGDGVDCVVQVHKNRSLMDKILRRNQLSSDDPVFRRLESIIRGDAQIRDVEVETGI